MDQRSASVLHLRDHSRRVAERDARKLALLVASEAHALASGDFLAVYDVHRLANQLLGIVMHNRLDAA